MASESGDKELEIFQDALDAALKLLAENNISVHPVAQSVRDCIDASIEANYSKTRL